jgi:hypothetical protein
VVEAGVELEPSEAGGDDADAAPSGVADGAALAAAPAT